MPKLLVLVAVAAALMSVGCREDADLTQAVSDTSITDPLTTDPPDAQTADAWLSDFTIGTVLNPEGRVLLGEPRAALDPGATLYFAMAINDAPPGAIVRTIWYGRDSLKVHEETRQVVAGENYLHFQSPPTESWPPGSYKVEAWAGNQMVRSEQFEIRAPK